MSLPGEGAPDYEHQVEHYLQGHFHPDVQPDVRREIRLGTSSHEGFLRWARIFKANHAAFDAQMEHEGVAAGFDSTGEYIERTPVAQADFEARRVDL